MGFWSRECAATTFTNGGCCKDPQGYSDVPGPVPGLAQQDSDAIERKYQPIMQMENVWDDPTTHLETFESIVRARMNDTESTKHAPSDRAEL